MKPSDSNEAGHWESVALMKLNDAILESAGSKWHDWSEFNPGWYSSPKAAEFKEKALTVLEGEFGRSSLLVLKDPRICRFAPFWIDVLEAAGVQPAIVTQVRNPLEVAGSLHRRNGFDPALGHLLWLRHVLDAESGSRGHVRFHASYDGLLNGWPRLVSEMQQALQLSWPRLSPRTSGEIGGFLTEELRHHAESRDKLLDNPMVSGWIRDSFAIFIRWAQDGESEADYAALDRIRAELNDAAPAFAQLIISGHQRAEELKVAQRRIVEQEQELGNLVAELKAPLAESQQALSEARATLEQNKSELDSLRGELSQTQSALAQRSAEADEVTAQLRQEEQRHAEELKAERDRHASDIEAQRSRASVEIENLRQEKGAAEARLKERFREIATMTTMLAEKEATARQSQEQVARLRQISTVLMNGTAGGSLKARLALLMPESTRLRKRKARLKRAGIFDADAYLAANPDVAAAGEDPLWHYINHGIAEGRPIGEEPR